jgi:predicted naringenin-chalcone synthase
MAAQKLSFEPDEVGFLMACCNAHDYICPNLSSLLLRKLRLSSGTKHCTLQGFGCTSFIVALQLAQNYFAENSGKQVAIVTSEVNSMLFANDLRSVVKQNAELKPGTREWVTLIEAMLFGDGAAATLISDHDVAVRIRNILHVTNLDAEDYKLGFAGSSFYLSREIPAAGERYTSYLLGQLGVDPKSFSKILIHTGSRKILDSVLAAIGCRPEVAQESYHVLLENGNLSGASLQFILKEALESGFNGSGLMLGFGLGFHAGTAIIERT